MQLTARTILLCFSSMAVRHVHACEHLCVCVPNRRVSDAGPLACRWSLSECVLPFTCVLTLITEDFCGHSNEPNHARDHQEVDKHAASVKLLWKLGRPRPSSPRVDVLVDVIMRRFVSPVIEMGNVCSMSCLSGAKPVKATIAFRSGFVARRVSSMWIVMGVFCSLRAMPPIAATLVEARRRAPECTPPFV